MTHQEAIYQILTMIYYYNSLDCDEEEKKDVLSLEMAVEALKKQIPEKLKITESTKRCSKCKRQISGIGNIHSRKNYCVNCGQRIDWT